MYCELYSFHKTYIPQTGASILEQARSKASARQKFASSLPLPRLPPSKLLLPRLARSAARAAAAAAPPRTNAAGSSFGTGVLRTAHTQQQRERSVAMAGAPRGAFILLEGVDRSGKSTQAARLVDALKAQGVRHRPGRQQRDGGPRNRVQPPRQSLRA
jgi:hypothetical protein